MCSPPQNEHIDIKKEICSWLQTFRPSNPGGSEEHISLITNIFNDFAFIFQFQHKGYLNSWLICLFYDRPFLHACNLVENLLFSTLILGSVFNDYVVFYRDILTGCLQLMCLAHPPSNGRMTISHNLARSGQQRLL